MMPSRISDSMIRGYEARARRLSYLQDALLLLVRVYWGWSFVMAGWGKLSNLGSAAQFFASLGIPVPAASAAVSGAAESLGGALLVVGLASRPAAAVLSINMVVAYLAAHRPEALALFSRPHEFVTAPPFLHLLVSLIVLAFGAGMISLDHLLKLRLARHRAGLVGAGPAATDTSAPTMSRRRAAQLTAAAVSGLIAGALLRGAGNARPKERSASTTTPSGDDLAGIDAAAPPGIQPSLLLLSELHVCRGLNTCKGLGRDGKNACAGQGACATAQAHACNGLNACKGQGGCGEYPGQNQCDGKGACAVPLKADTWQKARAAFEKLMAARQRSVGTAPAPPT